MIYFKHTGIYVDDLLLMSEFYQKTFNLIPICENEADSGQLYQELYGEPDAKAYITKLVSEYGKQNGQGDMLELVQVDRKDSAGHLCRDKRVIKDKEKRYIYQSGTSHLALGVNDIDTVLQKVCLNGGNKLTDIVIKGQRKCCFCTDPEGNFIELIE